VKSRLLCSLLFALALGASPAFAQRTPVAIVNYFNIPIADASGQPVRTEQVKKAIQDGANTRGWTLADEPSNKMLATLVVRNKHTIMVEITYSAQRYSLRYRDSVNMNYHSEARYDSRLPASRSGSTPRGPVIHPAYNTWVQELKTAIDVELRRPKPAREKAAGGLDDVDAVPGLDERGKQGYRLWLTQKTPRAFVVASDGRWNSAWGTTPQKAGDPTDPAERAMALCARAGKPDCKLYAVDEKIVWQP
jgi:hypothetical protein